MVGRPLTAGTYDKQFEQFEHINTDKCVLLLLTTRFGEISTLW